MKTITIKDYRSVQAAEVHLAPITAIVGPSDAGKSNIVRALRSAFYGERGNACIRHGAPFATVEVDGYTWTKKRGKGETTTGAHAFHAIQADVDLTIPINVASQHDPPFLLTERPSTVAKLLGAATGVHVVFAARRAATKALVAVRAEHERAEKTIADITPEVDALADLVHGLQARETRATELWATIQGEQERQQMVARARAALGGTMEAVRAARATLAGLPPLRVLEAHGERVRALLADATELASLSTLFADAVRARKEANERLKRAPSAEVEIGTECPLCGSQLRGATR